MQVRIRRSEHGVGLMSSTGSQLQTGDHGCSDELIVCHRCRRYYTCRRCSTRNSRIARFDISPFSIGIQTRFICSCCTCWRTNESRCSVDRLARPSTSIRLRFGRWAVVPNPLIVLDFEGVRIFMKGGHYRRMRNGRRSRHRRIFRNGRRFDIGQIENALDGRRLSCTWLPGRVRKCDRRSLRQVATYKVMPMLVMTWAK